MPFRKRRRETVHFKNKAGRRALALSLCAVLVASVLSPLGADAVQAQESRQDEGKAGREDDGDDVLESAWNAINPDYRVGAFIMVGDEWRVKNVRMGDGDGKA